MKKSIFSFLVVITFSQNIGAVTSDDGVNVGTSNTVPIGSNSIVAGADNNVSNYSLAVGNGGIAQYGSFALGETNSAFFSSIAAGFWNQMDPYSGACMALGEGNNATYTSSSALLGAYNNTAMQWGSAAIGFSNQMLSTLNRSSCGNVVIGQLNTIDQTGSGAPSDLQATVLVGCNNWSSESMAYAFGLGNIAQSNTVTIGTYASQVSNAAVILGNGGNDSSRMNGLVVFKNGLVDIPGSLSVGGSAALTQANASTTLQGQGFVTSTYLSTNNYLKRETGVGTTANSSAYMSIGNGASAGPESLAIGHNTLAQSTGSIAIGNGSNALGWYSTALQGAMAEGQYSFAASGGCSAADYSTSILGWATGECSVAIGGFDESGWWFNEANGIGSTAIGGATNLAAGDYSYAMGWNSVAIGRHSYSIGHLTRTNGYAVSMGSQNLSANNLMPHMENNLWVEDGALFELGNGKPNVEGGNNDFSNAITTLKNGQTTLTNKEWKANTGNPLADPTPSTDSGGEALVVEGHTRLKGKVVIEQPQGDINMGDYE